LAKRKATEQEIEDFLEEFRLRCRPKVEIEPRPEYIGFLFANNLLQEDAYSVILNELNHTHYVSGPEDDYNKKHPDPVWKFKIKKFDTTIYIKLKLYTGKLGLPCSKCLSFHDDSNKF